MFWYLLALPALVATAYGIHRGRRGILGWRHEFQTARARELFFLQRERLAGLFLKAAAQSGKPRGLRWTQCIFESELVLARDLNSRQLIGLVPLTIHFEAIEGSDMEGHSEVGYPRSASALLFFARGQWHTAGKAIFNLSPREAIERHKDQLQLIVETATHQG